MDPLTRTPCLGVCRKFGTGLYGGLAQFLNGFVRDNTIGNSVELFQCMAKYLNHFLTPPRGADFSRKLRTLVSYPIRLYGAQCKEIFLIRIRFDNCAISIGCTPKKNILQVRV